MRLINAKTFLVGFLKYRLKDVLACNPSIALLFRRTANSNILSDFLGCIKLLFIRLLKSNGFQRMFMVKVFQTSVVIQRRVAAMNAFLLLAAALCKTPMLLSNLQLLNLNPNPKLMSKVGEGVDRLRDKKGKIELAVLLAYPDN